MATFKSQQQSNISVSTDNDTSNAEVREFEAAVAIAAPERRAVAPPAAPARSNSVNRPDYVSPTENGASSPPSVSQRGRTGNVPRSATPSSTSRARRGTSARNSAVAPPRPQSAPRARAAGHQQGPPRTPASRRRSTSGSRGGTPWYERLHAAAQTDSQRKQSFRNDHVGSEVDECTFKPEIRKLPSMYGTQHALERIPFAERIQQWKAHTSAETKRRQAEEEQKEVEGCTFKPEINPNSRTAAERRRQQGVPVSERLFRQQKGNMSNSSFRKKPEESMTQEERELREECTFQPRITPYRSAQPVGSRYLDTSAQSVQSVKERPLPSGLEECTFTPRVNEVPAAMGSAQMYMRENIFERLSRVRRIEADKPTVAGGERSEMGGGGREERRTMDMQSFLSAAAESPAGGRTGGGRTRQTPSGDEKPRAKVMPAAQREQAFSTFLARQEAKEKAKQRKMQHLQQSSVPEYKPKLCANSMKIVQRTREGTFLDRIERDALRRDHEQNAKKDVDADPECTFQPAILPASKSLTARSVVELSKGDALKRETAQRLMRLKAEQDELAGLTFKPRTNSHKAHLRGVKGKLRVTEDPDSYIERIQRENQSLNAKRQQQLMQRDEQEYVTGGVYAMSVCDVEAMMCHSPSFLAWKACIDRCAVPQVLTGAIGVVAILRSDRLSECTFRPEIHDAPEYISRIARSMALAKTARPEQPAAKPDWR